MHSRHFVSWGALLGAGLLASSCLAPTVALASGEAAGARAERALRTGAPADSLRSLLEEARGLADRGKRRDKAAQRLLAAELSLELGDVQQALRWFSEAIGPAERGPWHDDAAFGRALAMERNGDDAGALEAWEEWLREHRGSALLGEALLRQHWLALRMGDLELAAAARERLLRDASWMNGDSRVDIALATAQLLGGESAAAQERLAGTGDAPAAIFLRGLALQQQGQALPAAARFQELVQKHPGSPLADWARLAKADVFLRSGAHASAAEEMGRAAELAANEAVVSEAQFRRGLALALDGRAPEALEAFAACEQRWRGREVAARAQLALGELLFTEGQYPEAILALNEVLTRYFQHSVAASAQYRVGVCLERQGRGAEAVGAWEAVVRGYPQEPEAPAAAYRAGVNLLELDRPREAADYFQIVLDRYTVRDGADGSVVFARSADAELTEAALCLLELSWYRAGDLGQMAGAPHVLLHSMPPSDSPWRAWALLLDADAMAAQGRLEPARSSLLALLDSFPSHPATLPAHQLLAWSWARSGDVDKALAVERRMLDRYAPGGDMVALAGARLRTAHMHFNRHDYELAAESYQAFLNDHAGHPAQGLALLQLGMCHLRAGRAGDAVDEWEALVSMDPASEEAQQAWGRLGDTYFQARQYSEAQRAYRGLLENAPASPRAASARLRVALCAFNAGQDEAAVDLFQAVLAQHPGSAEATEAEQGLQQALLRLGEGEGGAQALASLVERYPDSPFAADAQMELGHQQLEAGEFGAAAESFRRVVSGFPGYAQADRAQLLRAESLERAGDLDGARGALEQFVAFFPTSPLAPPAQLRLGNTLYAGGDLSRAAVQFQLAMDGSDDEEVVEAALFNLVLAQQGLGQGPAALAALEGYRERFGDGARSLEVAALAGDLLRELGEPAAALDEYSRALGEGPSPARAVELHFRVAQCHEQLGDEAAALKAYTRASKAGVPANDDFRLSAVARCAALYEGQEDWKSALASWKDLARNAADQELATAAGARAGELEAFVQ